MTVNSQYSNFFKKNEKKVIFIFVFLMFLIIDFSFSLISNKFNLSLFCKNRLLESVAIKHPIYHHGFKANSSGKGYGCEKVFTNSMGFKDKAIKKVEEQIDIDRILFIGDSFTEGVGLNYQYTFVGIIDEIYSKQNVDILNAGRSSYSPIIYWRKIKYLIEEENLKFDKLFVFLDISDTFDELRYDLDQNLKVVDVRFEENETDENKTNLNANLKKFIKTNFIISFYFLNFFHDLFINFKHDQKEWYISTNLPYERWTVDDDLLNEYGVLGLKKMKKYMDKLYDLSIKHQFDLSIAVYPRPTQIWEEDLNSIQVEFWKKWATNKNINFINYFPDFVKINTSKKERYKILKKNYLLGDPHFNINGNQIIANKINEHLKIYFKERKY